VDAQDLQPEGNGGRLLGGGGQLQQRLLDVGGAGAAGLDDAAVEGLGAGQVVGVEASQCVPDAGRDVHQIGSPGRVVQVGFQPVEGSTQSVPVVGDGAGTQFTLAAQEPEPQGIVAVDDKTSNTVCECARFFFGALSKSGRTRPSSWRYYTPG
jgi:hypothetical protein